jgi:hypothetical protein
VYNQVWSDLILGTAESLQLGRSQGARRQGNALFASPVSLETALGVKNVGSRVDEKEGADLQTTKKCDTMSLT